MPTAMPVPDFGPSNAAPPYRDHLSLADALDRILQRGVSVQGNLTIGLADVDLLFLDLRLLLGSVDAIWPDGRPPVSPVRPRTPSSPSPSEASSNNLRPESTAVGPRSDRATCAPEYVDADSPIVRNDRRSADGSSPAQGLVRLVLTLVKLLHDVFERQAVRRMDAGRLTDAQVDNVGMALIAQAQEILRLQRQFGFSDKDIVSRSRRPGRRVMKGIAMPVAQVHDAFCREHEPRRFARTHPRQRSRRRR